ncbi:BNR repeat-containing protein [Catenovulum sp. 2E275]|uniref:BNR repeat-containing protein n=1 Tax=Catenovulum sp. 2E275 TaxID=2980497 RepID=UPI0021CF838F|nr:BNR repeat-containing protein [Catenovulum sp. 2E275]MCU4675909.1 BNR repeat-containing protein [Catenovulum sp. 2E275]
MKKLTSILFMAAVLQACSHQPAQVNHPVQPEPVIKNTAQLLENKNPNILLISDQAFAGSSVNVLAGVKQTVFTAGEFQFSAFYNADAHLVIAKRKLDSQQWQTQVTDFKGNVNDAHNHISLVADGDGYLHLAWDHHNTQLKYARSTQPYSLQLKKQPMLAKTDNEFKTMLEHSVTYPQFYQLKNGDLLFAYRNGGSGRGNLVLNQYKHNSKQWQRLHDNLIDGEGKRSAYWDMAIDENGVLHLAWIWRETPDVASNHDIAYARSDDQGLSWQTIDKQAYQLPIVASTSDIVKQIPKNHKLMNPPVVAADSNSMPFIASYWADSPTDKPGYKIVYAAKPTATGYQWNTLKAPKVAENFELSGHGTKRPPISRAALLVDTQNHQRTLHLIYRNDFQQGHILLSTVDDLTDPIWQQQTLVNQNMGAWEPSIDPVQWNTYKQAHLLLQTVGQDDGNDAQSLDLAPSNIELLIWKSN